MYFTKEVLSSTWDILKEKASNNENICNENGLVAVSHENADIPDAGYINKEDAIANLKKTEYRYCGENPNNYVTFNNEKAGWRIIGLVNTPEGERIKLIRAKTIGAFSKDNKKDNEGSSTSENGSNDWTDATLQIALNEGAYYNRTTGNCPSAKNGVTKTCDFSENSQTPGLTEEAKSMIDTVTWNLGGCSTTDYVSTDSYYNYERGIEAVSNHKMLWEGKVGLIYPSDYEYATGGGNNIDRITCLNKEEKNWTSTNYKSNCINNDWIYKINTGARWTLMPSSVLDYKTISISNGNVYVSVSGVYGLGEVIPSIYLKPEVAISGGYGTSNEPYTLSIN